jgi:hypothetical protein
MPLVCPKFDRCRLCCESLVSLNIRFAVNHQYGRVKDMTRAKEADVFGTPPLPIILLRISFDGTYGRDRRMNVILNDLRPFRVQTSCFVRSDLQVCRGEAEKITSIRKSTGDAY